MAKRATLLAILLAVAFAAVAEASRELLGMLFCLACMMRWVAPLFFALPHVASTQISLQSCNSWRNRAGPFPYVQCGGRSGCKGGQCKDAPWTINPVKCDGGLLQS